MPPHKNRLRSVVTPSWERHQWFELHDLPWWPASFRSFLTNVLILVWGFPWIEIKWRGRRVVPSFASLSARVLERFFDNIERRPSGGSDPYQVRSIIDLCSGSGGPWNELYSILNRDNLHVWLTDLYPAPTGQRLDTDHDLVEHQDSPVDATMVSSELTGVRTLFGCFHHFTPELGTLILQDCVDQKEPVVVIETCERSWIQAIGAGLLMTPLAFATPILCFRRTPWSSFLLTYVIPVLPLVVCFDGMVSCFRGYRCDELRGIVSDVENSEDYEWTIGKESFFGLFALTYLTGRPKDVVQLDRPPSLIGNQLASP